MDFRTCVLYFLSHAAILHNTFLHVLDMDILLHADVFFYKILQFDIHSEWDGPLEEKGEFFRVQAPQVGIVEYAAESLVVGGQEIILPAVIRLKIVFYFHDGHGPFPAPVAIFPHGSFVPEETAGYLIGGCLHIKDNSHTLALARIASFQLQHNGGGKILVAQIGKLVVFTDIYHTS